MNKNLLMNFFRTNEKIGELLGIAKQSVFVTTNFNNVKHVRKLEKALDKRFDELKQQYKQLKLEARQVRRNI